MAMNQAGHIVGQVHAGHAIQVRHERALTVGQIIGVGLAINRIATHPARQELTGEFVKSQAPGFGFAQCEFGDLRLKPDPDLEFKGKRHLFGFLKILYSQLPDIGSLARDIVVAAKGDLIVKTKLGASGR